MDHKLNLNGESSTTGIGDISAEGLDSLPRHRWYFLKEAFSPNVVKQALKDSGCGEGDVVLDPFSGSGTVSVVASQWGCRTVGLEVNPFLQFVSNTKLAQCQPRSVEQLAESVCSGIRKGATSDLENFSTFSSGGSGKKWLFNKPVLEGFEGGWQNAAYEDKETQEVVRLALIGAALDVCNATKDGKCLRYRSDWEEREYDKEDLSDAFEKRLEAVKDDLQNAPLEASESCVFEWDARKITEQGAFEEKFDLCVMSPPYLNSFDYTDVYRPELFLGKFVKSMQGLRDLRHRTLRSHIQVKWEDPTESDFGKRYQKCVKKIEARAGDLWDKRIPDMVQAYFQDMRAVLKGLRLRAREGASTWIVVSTSAYAGIEVPVDLILADLAAQVDWEVREVKNVRKLRRVSVQQWDALSKQMNDEDESEHPYLRESVIVLDA